MTDIPSLARRHGLPLTPDGRAIACPFGRIVPFGDGELAFTGATERKLKPREGMRIVFRRNPDITLAFAPWALTSVLRMLAI